MHIVLPFTGRHGEAVLATHFAGAFDAVADLRPAAAALLLELAQQRWRAPPSGSRPADRRGPSPMVAIGMREPTSSCTPTVRLAAALSEIDHAEAVARADGDRAAGFAHQLIAIGLRQMAHAHIGQRGIAERHGCRRELVLLEARNRRQITELCQRIGQPRDRSASANSVRAAISWLPRRPSLGRNARNTSSPRDKRDDKAAIGRRFLRLAASFVKNRICGLSR